jgi:hypothetical protein
MLGAATLLVVAHLATSASMSAQHDERARPIIAIIADSVARRVGVKSWGTEHHTDAFGVSRWMYVKGVWSYLAWWRHDLVGIPVADGFDEVALALTIDAVSRTLRGKPFTWSNDGRPVQGRQGLRIAVDRARSAVPADSRDMSLSPRSLPPAGALDSAIVRLTRWYGSDAAELIEMGMEYQYGNSSRTGERAPGATMARCRARCSSTTRRE